MGKPTLYTWGINKIVKNRLKIIFPFQHLDINEGFGYLKYNLNPNRYVKAKWN